jgi:hypothetical protein
MARPLSGFFIKKKPPCTLFAWARQFWFCSNTESKAIRVGMKLRFLKIFAQTKNRSRIRLDCG